MYMYMYIVGWFQTTNSEELLVYSQVDGVTQVKLLLIYQYDESYVLCMYCIHVGSVES